MARGAVRDLQLPSRVLKTAAKLSGTVTLLRDSAAVASRRAISQARRVAFAALNLPNAPGSRCSSFSFDSRASLERHAADLIREATDR